MARPLALVRCDPGNGLASGGVNRVLITYLLERHSQINVYDLSGLFIQQNIVPMSVSESKDMTQNRYSCSTSSVCKPGGVPLIWSVESVHEEELHHRLKMLHNLLELAYPRFPAFPLAISNDLSTDSVFPILGIISRVCREQEIVNRNSVGDKFDDSGYGCQRNDFVRPDFQASLASDAILLQQQADLLENLFHDCVLS